MRIISTINFGDEGVIVEYLDSADRRTHGVTVLSACAIPAGAIYDEQIAEVLDAANDLLDMALEDWRAAGPTPDDADDEGDE